MCLALNQQDWECVTHPWRTVVCRDSEIVFWRLPFISGLPTSDLKPISASEDTLKGAH